MGNAADSFGSMVFSSSVMRQRLPGDVYRALKRTVRGGHKLDPAVAGAVAEAMKNWALEKGATQIASAYSALNDYASSIVTGVILFFILGSEFFVNYRVIFRKKAAKGGEKVC